MSQLGNHLRKLTVLQVQSMWPAGTSQKPRHLLRTKLQSKSFGRLANAVIEAEQLESGDGRPSDEHRCEVYGIERPNRFSRKRLPSAIDDLWTYPQHVPMGRRCRQASSSVGRVGFRELVERDSANQHSLALEDREVRGDDDVRSAQ